MKTSKSALFLSVIIACLFFGWTGRGIAQINARDLESRVRAALDPYSMHELFVSADTSGKVTITGKVDALYDKLDIYELASRVAGVTEIIEEVEVETPTLPDDVIYSNLVRAIKDNSIIMEPDKITVIVSSGFVFLKGTVSYPKEKSMAESIASLQDGVTGLVNEIDVLSSKNARSDTNIKSVLNEILKNQFPLIRQTVTINVVHGDVTLDGELGSLWEKRNLKKESLQVIGVKSVADSLKVKGTD